MNGTWQLEPSFHEFRTDTLPVSGQNGRQPTLVHCTRERIAAHNRNQKSLHGYGNVAIDILKPLSAKFRR